MLGKNQLSNFNLSMRFEVTRKYLFLANVNCNLATIEYNSKKISWYELLDRTSHHGPKSQKSSKSWYGKNLRSWQTWRLSINSILVNSVDNYSGNYYHLYDPKIDRINETNGIQLLNKIYYRHDIIHSTHKINDKTRQWLMGCISW